MDDLALFFEKDNKVWDSRGDLEPRPYVTLGLMFNA